VLHKVAGPRLADLVFHDLAGWLMMPLALALLWLELRLLGWVIVTRTVCRGPAPFRPPAGPPAGRGRGPGAVKPAPA
jgi:hypothetical protein